MFQSFSRNTAPLIPPGAQSYHRDATATTKALARSSAINPTFIEKALPDLDEVYRGYGSGDRNRIDYSNYYATPDARMVLLCPSQKFNDDIIFTLLNPLNLVPYSDMSTGVVPRYAFGSSRDETPNLFSTKMETSGRPDLRSALMTHPFWNYVETYNHWAEEANRVYLYLQQYPNGIMNRTLDENRGMLTEEDSQRLTDIGNGGGYSGSAQQAGQGQETSYDSGGLNREAIQLSSALRRM